MRRRRMSSISDSNPWTSTHPACRDDRDTWTTSRASAARTPTVPPTADAEPENLSVCNRYGKQNHIRLLDCNACKARFSERKGTPLFDCRMPEEKARSVLYHLAEGNGIRQTGRLVGVHRDTVVRLARTAGDQAHDAHDEFVAFSPSDERGPTRRGLVVRREEVEELRHGRSDRRPQGGLVGPCRLRRRATSWSWRATVRKEREGGPGRVHPPDGGPGGRAGGGGGPEGVGVQPDDQHLVRRAAACDRSGSERAEVVADVPVQQGLAGARGDDLLHGVSLQLLLAGAHAADQRGGWPLAAADTGDGGWVGGSCVVARGMDQLPGHSIQLGHHPLAKRDNATIANTRFIRPGYKLKDSPAWCTEIVEYEMARTFALLLANLPIFYRKRFCCRRVLITRPMGVIDRDFGCPCRDGNVWVGGCRLTLLGRCKTKKSSPAPLKN